MIDPKVLGPIPELEIDITNDLVDQEARLLCDAGADFLPKLNRLLDLASKQHALAKAEARKQLELPLTESRR